MTDMMDVSSTAKHCDDDGQQKSAGKEAPQLLREVSFPQTVVSRWRAWRRGRVLAREDAAEKTCIASEQQTSKYRESNTTRDERGT